MSIRMSRRVWVSGTALLLELLEDDLAVAKALKARRWQDLLAASEVAHAGVSPRMAATDPAQYKAIRDATTLFFLKGYRCLDRGKLSSFIEAERPSPLPMEEDELRKQRDRTIHDHGTAPVGASDR